jgi:pimeloyl-ACP methyl ester carboxylesterase
MHTVVSSDGMSIAYNRVGRGPTIICLAGAFNTSATCADLAEQLQDSYTVVCPDRRGRGDSSDAITVSKLVDYDVQREIEDLDAIIEAEGGDAMVFGFSSGAILALRAAAAGSQITRLALYEPPFAIGDLRGSASYDLTDKLIGLIVAEKYDVAVETMLREGILIPDFFVEQIRQSPAWPNMVAMAQSTVYDAALLRAPNIPTRDMSRLTVEALVLNGTESYAALCSASKELTHYLARAQYVAVAGGADHRIPAAATAAALERFLTRPSNMAAGERW